MNSLTLNQTIQRLVDAEIGDRERADLLKYAEQHPDTYRTIALSFVERDIWDRELQRSQDADAAALDEASQTDLLIAPMLLDSTLIDSTLRPEVRRTLGNHNATSHPEMTSDALHDSDPSILLARAEVNHGRADSRTHDRSRRESVSRIALLQLAVGVLAATVVIGLAGGSVGWWIGHRTAGRMAESPRIDSFSDASAHDSAQTAQQLNPISTNSITTHAMNWSPGSPIGVVRPVTSTLPSDLQMQLLRSGFVLEEQFNYVDVQLDSGQSVPVPVNELRVNYFGNRLYQ